MQIRILKKEDGLYRKHLQDIKGMTERLYYTGNILESDFEGIWVVGRRRMSKYGENCIESIVSELVGAGLTIISGLAFGVDVTAQKLALDLGGRTIAVLGSGINKIRPLSNFDTARRIVESGQGALISAYEPDEDSTKASFPERDFLMAALSRAVLVIEASEKSGTSHTVKAAVNLGKEVFVVPGSIFSDLSAGCHKYIRDGANLVTCADEIFEALRIKKSVLKSKIRLTEGSFEEKVYKNISSGGTLLEDLTLSLNEPAVKVLPCLTILEMKGLIKIDRDKIFNVK